MIDNPKVSILVPVYKVENLIKRCAVSLFEQTYDNIEYIFVDDCSPDRSIKVLRQVMERYPERALSVHILKHDHNRGQAAGRNTLIEAATGDYVTFVDSDDFVDKKMVEKCVAKITENNADIVRFNIKVLRKHYTQYYNALKTNNAHTLFLALVARKCYVCVCGGLYRRCLFIDNNIKCKEGLDIGEDWYMSLQLANNAKRVNYIDEILYFYDCTNENQSTYTFNDINEHKMDKTFEVVGQYIKNMDDEVVDSFKFALVVLYIGRLKNYTLASGNYVNEYHQYYNKIHVMEARYKKSIALRHRVLTIIPNYKIARLYMKLVKWCGETFRK